MNDQPPKGFESRIEQLVESIRASGRRRAVMREEILAHLSQAYGEELARCGDESAAQEESLRRFGDLNEVRRQLQASVPLSERWLFTLFYEMEANMLRNSRLVGWIMAGIGGVFMFGLAIVLPATAKLVQEVNAGGPGLALKSAPLLKESLISLTVFSFAVTLVGIGLVLHAALKGNRTVQS